MNAPLTIFGTLKKDNASEEAQKVKGAKTHCNGMNSKAGRQYLNAMSLKRFNSLHL